MTALPHQLILFGPPGTSKSHNARTKKAEALRADIGVDAQETTIVPVTFHPDYSYGEFVARLLPMSKDGQIEYHVHAGPFIRALAMAYLALEHNASGSVPNVLLLIDEINRGNCAEIFGDVFQLLDRNDDGRSSYQITVSDLVITALRNTIAQLNDGIEPIYFRVPEIEQYLVRNQLFLPENLFMIGTMNTSDESIYFMDSAFKRRWNFEFCPEGFDQVPVTQSNALMPLARDLTWCDFVDALNQFIRERCTAPRLDDKLIGPWFIKARSKVRIQTLAQAQEKVLNELQASASKFGTTLGVKESTSFDENLKALADRLTTENRERLLTQGGYDESAKLKFTRIRSESGHANPYYCSGKGMKKFRSNEKGLIVEDYLKELSVFELRDESYHIERADIVGKLFLYLWDNVFDRDKSPLCNLLGLEPGKLRTFGQFVEQADNFIEHLCPGEADVVAAVVTAENQVFAELLKQDFVTEEG
jgi:5-methylcytosine-specific restriction endonuclease McrBC GTP-binding regulatory subunit McrB